MSGPSTAAYGELILPVFTQWERVGSVTRILADLEQGIFYDPALLVDQMMRDDRIRATFNTRLTSVLGMPMHMEEAEHTAGKRATKVADEANALWPKMMPRCELMSLMKWGLLLGVGIARKEWRRDGTSWLPSIRVWHPAALRYDLINDQYMLRTVDKGEIAIEHNDPNWLLFTPYGKKYGRLEGMMRSLAMLYLCRQWAFRDRARHSEVHGMPMRQLIVPAEAQASDKTLIRAKTAAQGAETVVVTPQGMDGNKYDLKNVELLNNANEVFGGLIDHVDDSIAILILGQSDSTQQKGGLGAKQNAGDTVRRDIMRFDAACIGDIGQDDILADWAEFNYGSRDIAPRPCIEVDPPKDGKDKADELNTLGDAITKLEKYGVDVRKVLEETGVPMLTLEQAAAARQTAIEEAQQAMTPPADNKPAGEPAAGPDTIEKKSKTLLMVADAVRNARAGGYVIDAEQMFNDAGAAVTGRITE